MARLKQLGEPMKIQLLTWLMKQKPSSPSALLNYRRDIIKNI